MQITWLLPKSDPKWASKVCFGPLFACLARNLVSRTLIERSFWLRRRNLNASKRDKNSTRDKSRTQLEGSPKTSRRREFALVGIWPLFSLVSSLSSSSIWTSAKKATSLFAFYNQRPSCELSSNESEIKSILKIVCARAKGLYIERVALARQLVR